MRNFLEVLMGNSRGKTQLEPTKREKSGTAHFVHSLKKDQVRTALESVLNTTPSDDPLNQLEFAGISFQHLRKFTPPWLDVEALAARLAQLNSWRLWERLLSESGEDIQKGVAEHMESSDVKHSAKEIDTINTQFMTPTIFLAAFAAASGENMEYSLPWTTFKPVGWNVAVVVGKKIETPAENPEVFIDRLQHLFRIDLLPLLVEHKTFEIPNDSSRHCPAPTLTDWILKAHADMLSDPAYRAKFVEGISRI